MPDSQRSRAACQKVPSGKDPQNPSDEMWSLQLQHANPRTPLCRRPAPCTAARVLDNIEWRPSARPRSASCVATAMGALPAGPPSPQCPGTAVGSGPWGISVEGRARMPRPSARSRPALRAAKAWSGPNRHAISALQCLAQPEHESPGFVQAAPAAPRSPRRPGAASAAHQHKACLGDFSLAGSVYYAS